MMKRGEREREMKRRILFRFKSKWWRRRVSNSLFFLSSISLIKKRVLSPLAKPQRLASLVTSLSLLLSTPAHSSSLHSEGSSFPSTTITFLRSEIPSHSLSFPPPKVLLIETSESIRNLVQSVCDNKKRRRKEVSIAIHPFLSVPFIIIFSSNSHYSLSFSFLCDKRQVLVYLFLSSFLPSSLSSSKLHLNQKLLFALPPSLPSKRWHKFLDRDHTKSSIHPHPFSLK